MTSPQDKAARYSTSLRLAPLAAIAQIHLKHRSMILTEPILQFTLMEPERAPFYAATQRSISHFARVNNIDRAHTSKLSARIRQITDHIAGPQHQTGLLPTFTQGGLGRMLSPTHKAPGKNHLLIGKLDNAKTGILFH